MNIDVRHDYHNNKVFEGSESSYYSFVIDKGLMVTDFKSFQFLKSEIGEETFTRLIASLRIKKLPDFDTYISEATSLPIKYNSNIETATLEMISAGEQRKGVFQIFRVATLSLER